MEIKKKDTIKKEEFLTELPIIKTKETDKVVIKVGNTSYEFTGEVLISISQIDH